MNKLLDKYKRLFSIAKAGLTYTENPFDLERYEELEKISLELISDYSGESKDYVKEQFESEKGYQTPKMDIRAVVMNENKLLMVKEVSDGKWSLPGGWADVGYSPYETAVKETEEESGYIVEAERLIALMDKNKHEHPPTFFHAYKIFVLCKLQGGESAVSSETTDVGFFGRDELPPLSVGRNTKGQIDLIFDLVNSDDNNVYCD